ncbi:MAG TPA: transglycosylase SLT domain-containing protein [Chloroflexia bacterium]|nr:transglycosylase SLT domain-containing protein [Chloroflexia bacterium]
MDSNPPQDMPPVKVRVHDTAPQHTVQPGDNQAIAAEALEAANKAPTRRVPAWVPLAALLAVLAVLGGTTWWAITRGQGGPSSGGGRSSLPGDAVALINSSTPLPSIVPAGPRDVVGDLSYEPEQDRWSAGLREAYRAMEEGRHSAAISQFSALVGDGTGAESRDALWGLAAAYWQGGQADSSIRAYTLLSQLDDPRSARAVARIAHIYEQTGREPEAVSAYDSYLQRAGPARHALMLMKARLLGATQPAEDVYKALVDDNPSDLDLRDALLAWADVKSRRNDHRGAMQLYDRLAALQASDPRPLLDNYGLPAAVHAANEARLAGDANLARTRLLAYIKGQCGEEGATPCPDYPYGTYSAVEALIKLEPSAMLSGTVEPMMAARAAYESGYFNRTIGFLDTLRQSAANAPQLAEASLLTGKAYQSSGAYESAYNWYTATVQTYPTSTFAVEANRRAGDTLRDQALWDEAMGAYQQTVSTYPGAGDETIRARLNGGVLAYRLEQRDVALGLLEPVLSAGEVSPTLKSDALFWVGKVRKGQGDASWRNNVSQVPTLNPGSFYAFRAQSMLDGAGDGGPLALTALESGVTAEDLGVDYGREAQERGGLLSWAAGLQPPGASTPGATSAATQATTPTQASTASGAGAANGIDGPLAQDPEMLRAASLFQMGFEAEAYGAYRILAERLRDRDDGASLAHLVIYLRYNSNANIAMRVSELLAAMDAGNPLERPTLLLKIMYPTPFEELVLQETAQQEIDPLVMYALMRQESQFIPAARSHADARGLTQVIPSTGEGIAEQLGDNNFSPGDLYVPHVNVRYGTYYLASNLPTFDRKLLPGLAAYNGGPGNADRWLAGSALIDPDLYVERIDLFETEDYLRRVYQNYGFYRLTYGR